MKSESQNWPKCVELSPESNEDSIEKQNVLIVHNKKPSFHLEKIIDCRKYSSYNKLLGITALVLKFIKKLRKQVSNRNAQTVIDLDDIEHAEKLWHREIQKSFEEDPKCNERKKNLRIITDDDGVYRVSGRLENAPIPFSAKYPVLLPKRHHFTKLVIRKHHEIVKHNGTNETLTQLRSKYWICKGRQIVKTALSKCFQCKKIMGKS